MENKIVEMMLAHDEKLKNIEQNIFSKKDGEKLFNVLDEQSSILKRLDQERVFSNKAIERNAQRLDSQDKDIHKIKDALNI